MLKIKSMLIVALAGLLASSVASAATDDSTMNKIIKSGKMHIAVQTQGPPVSFIDKHGKRTGLAIDIAQMFADDMGIELVIQDYDWKGLIPALTSGKVDFIAADMTPTAKRHMQILFTDPAFFSENVAYAKKDKEIGTWQNLNSDKYSLATSQASSYSDLARKLLPNAKLKEYAGGNPQSIQAVLSDRVDAGISDLAFLSTYLKEYPELEVLGTIRKEPLGFAVRPESMHMLLAMNNYLRLIAHDGRLDQMLDYWWKSTNWEADHK